MVYLYNEPCRATSGSKVNKYSGLLTISGCAPNGDYSQWNDVTSGIAQGSVLGPILSIIYINDLHETVESMVHIFADDTKIYRKIATENDSVELQKDLDILQEWSNKWLLNTTM